MNIDFKGNVIIGHKSLPDWTACDEAKQLLDEKGESYIYIISDKLFFGQLMKETKSTKVPQIYMKGEFVGSIQQLKEYLETEWNPWYKARQWTSTSGRIA